MANIKYLVYGILSLCPLIEALSSNLTCLKCDIVAKPTACRFIDRCGPHEVCSIVSTVTPIGSIVFRLGCIDRAFCGARKRELTEQDDDVGTEICNECCTGNLCNSAGCGHTGFSPDLGPVCHFCDLHIGPSSCSEIKQCGRDQICELHPVKREGSYEDWYQSQCIHTYMCKGGHTVETQDSATPSTYTCNVCCSTNVCNNQVPANCHAIPAIPGVTHQPAVTNAPHVTHQPAVTNAPHTTSNIKRCHSLWLSHAAHEYMGSCYMYVQRGMTWFDAENRCKVHGGHLVTIDNAGENNFITHLVLPYHHSFWIGLNDQNLEDTFTWISGSSSTYRQFLPGYKHPDHRRLDCVKFILYPSSSGDIGWDDSNCTEQLGFICEIPSQTNLVSTATPAGTLPIVYGDPSSCSQQIQDHAKKRHDILFGLSGTSNCYTLVKHSYYTTGAKIYCTQNHYGHLADISDTHEQEAVEHFLRHYIPGQSAWIGLHREGADYKSSSGATATYFNWGQISHTHHHNSGDSYLCAYISVRNGKWGLGYCGSVGLHDQKRYFLCEMDHSVSLSAGALVG